MTDSPDLASFVALQRRLLECLRRSHPAYFADELLLGAPRRSELDLDGDAWDVLKHGTGVRLTRREREPNVVVDVHAELGVVDRIDAWRLMQFVESIGRPCELDEAETWLRRELDAGAVVQRVNGSYLLSD